MGVNSTSRNVIVYGTKKWFSGKSVPISVAEYKNMSGRAGRYSAGDLYGTSYLLASSQSAKDIFVHNYILGSLEGFRSAFGDRVIDMQVLEIVAGNLATSTQAVSEFIFKTYNGKFKWKTEQSRKAIHQMVVAGVDKCTEAGAIDKTKAGVLEVTEAGRLCAAGGFSLLHLEMARSYLSQCGDVLEGSALFWALTTDYKCGSNAYYIGKPRTEEYRSKHYQRLLGEMSDIQRLGTQLDELAGRPESIRYEDVVVLKRALACLVWISETPTKKLLDMFPGVATGAIRNTAQVCARLISFLQDLSSLDESDHGVQDGFAELVVRLAYGSTTKALLLARIRHSGLTRDERNHLVTKGITGIDDLLDREINDIPLPRAKTLRLLTAIEEAISDDLERKRRSHKSRLNAVSVDTAVLDSIYSSQGKDL